MTATVVRHGTTSGYTLHIDLGERPCDPCYFAKQDYDAKYRRRTEAKKKATARARAQQRAHTELVASHKSEYDSLYHKHLLELEQELSISLIKR